MNDIAISAGNLSKSYRLYATPKDRLKELLHPFGRKYHADFWALKNVTFDIRKGETVGIVGRNGSGKSTLLQLVCGILQPTNGEIKVSGRISALLELGAGFSPEFTGRDNVYLNGAILGISREEMDERFPSIAAFADIGDFIDRPVKTYSSGMFVRLAFACAVSVDPDILVVDEALAVGDRQFQVKCAKKMRGLIEDGVTLLVVSHDSYTVKNLCQRAVWLDEGTVRSAGTAVEVVDRYHDFVSGLNARNRMSVPPSDDAAGTQAEVPRHLSEIRSVAFFDKLGREVTELAVFDDLRVIIEYEVHEDIGPLFIGFAIFDNSDNYVFGLNTQLADKDIASHRGRHEMTITFPRLRLLPGTYHLNIGLFHKESKAVALDFRKQVKSFYVTASAFMAEGLVYLDTEWKQ